MKAALAIGHRSRNQGRLGGAFGFAVLWAALMAGLVALELTLAHQGLTARTLSVIALFAAGGFGGALFARLLAGLATRFRPQPSARFAAKLFGLTTGTIGMTALLHFLHFRSFYAQWHSGALSLHWFVELLMTGASSAYIFTVESAPLLLPWGLPLLFAAAWDYAAVPAPARR